MHLTLLIALWLFVSKANHCEGVSTSKSITATLDARWKHTPLLLEARYNSCLQFVQNVCCCILSTWPHLCWLLAVAGQSCLAVVLWQLIWWKFPVLIFVFKLWFIAFSFSEFIATENNQSFWKFVESVHEAHTFKKPSGKQSFLRNYVQLLLWPIMFIVVMCCNNIIPDWSIHFLFVLFLFHRTIPIYSECRWYNSEAIRINFLEIVIVSKILLS